MPDVVLDLATMQFIPANYTRTPSGSEDARALAAHLRGIDGQFATQAAAAAASSEDALLAGIADQTPISTASWDLAFWTRVEDPASADYNALTITTTLVRLTSGTFLLPKRPSSWRFEIQDQVGHPLAIRIRYQKKTGGWNNPLALAISSGDPGQGTVGTRREVSIEFSSISTSEFPALAVAEVITPGGGVLPYTLYRHYGVF